MAEGGSTLPETGNIIMAAEIQPTRKAGLANRLPLPQGLRDQAVA